MLHKPGTLLGSPGGSKENRHTCLSKRCWFSSHAVSSEQDWSNRLSLPLCPHFTPSLSIYRSAQSATVLAVRNCHLICPFQFILQPLVLSSCFHGLRSTAGNPLAEIIYHMGEGCFISIPSTVASSTKRNRGVHPHVSLVYIICLSWAFQKDSPSYRSALEGVLLQSHQLMEIRFPLKPGKDNPKITSNFSVPLLRYITLGTFAK